MPQVRKVTRQVWVLLGICFVLVFISALNLVHFRHLSNEVYDRCVKTSAAGQAGVDARKTEIMQFRAFAAQEKVNPFIDAALRKKRVDGYTSMADGLQHAIDLQPPPSDCEKFR